MNLSCDVCIRGAGPVGMALALALSRQGLTVGVVAPAAAFAEPAAAARDGDVRTYALNAASRRLLEQLKVWQALPADAVTAVDDMAVFGDAAARRHSARLDFSAWQQGAEALAWIVDAAELERVLRAALQFAPHVVRLDQPAAAPLQVLAEGKDSASRAAFGVRFERQAYAHTALAARLVADVPHGNLARQWFGADDVLALLPFDRPQPGHSYGLVWSMPAERAQRLAQAPVDEFVAALAQASAGQAGTLRLHGVRACWPLALARADQLCGPGWVLVGDAAHQVHPLAGQGLNLGLGDVASLATVVAEREPWRGLGDLRLLRRHERARALPTQAMALLTDGLVHLFADRSTLAREVRNRGLALVNQLAPLKRALTARAIDA